MLAALAVIVLIMLVSITGKETFNPGKWHQQFKVGLGLDLSSGTQVMLKAYSMNGKPPSASDMAQAINILESRVNGTGTSGATVQQQGTDQINVSVPGQTEQQVIGLVSSTARLAFRPVLLWQPYMGPPKPGAKPATSTALGDATKVDAATKALFNKLVCKPGPNPKTVNDSWKATVGYTNQLSQWDDPNSQSVSCNAAGDKFALDKPVFLGTDVASVSPQPDQNATDWVVAVKLHSGRPTQAFGALTTEQYNKYFVNSQGGNPYTNDGVLSQNAVVLGGNVVSNPMSQQPLTAGTFQITGGSPGHGFTLDQATNLANIIGYGQLPLNLTRQYASYISPTLGHNSLVAGLIAGIIGLLIVVIYLFFYYRGLGFLAVSSLVLAALLSYLGVVLLSAYAHFTLELAGIAGLIVAIGITADSFIVYFERLRDEVRDGKQLRPAVESGWRRARRTIVAADTVSFLAAVLLYKFATSDVQGFAFTLGLTTLIDVLVVFTFTKPMMTLLAGTKFFGGGHKWSGLDPKRLGARTPWRSGVRRQQRTTRTRTPSGARPASSTTPTREA